MAESKPKAVFARLRALKNKEILIAVVAVAVMLAVYFSTLTGKSEGKSAAAAERDYCADLETEVKNAVVRMSGDKNAQVIVNWQTGVESVIAYTETHSSGSSSASPTVVGGLPVVLREVYPDVRGVVVVVKGGQDVKLRLDIMNMLATLLGTSPEKIAVYGSKT